MSYTIENGDAYQALTDAQQTWVLLGYGVPDIAGGDVNVTVNTGTLDASDTLSVAAGDIRHNGSIVSVTSQNVGINSENNGYRYDTIWVDNTGTVQKEEGTPVPLTSAEQNTGLRFDKFSPAIPFPSTTPAVVVGVVAVSDSDTSVVSAQIQDRRVDSKIDATTVDAHATTHENGGSDEINVGGLAGDLADPQDPKTHASSHSDGASDEIQVDELAGDNGTSGQFLQTDGAALSFVTIAENEPDWVLDGNSPQTDTGVTSSTYTLSGSYDEVMVRIQVDNTTANSDAIDLRLNGDTGANYRVRFADGTSSGTETEIPLLTIGQNDFNRHHFELDGRWGVTARGGGPANGFVNNAVGFENGNISSPLSSMTLLAAETSDIYWEVYGRDLSGGAP